MRKWKIQLRKWKLEIGIWEMEIRKIIANFGFRIANF